MPSRSTISCILYVFYLLLLYFILYLTLDLYSNFTEIYYGIARKARVQSGSFLLLDYV